MSPRSNIFDESPAEDGPDYVALVIEWDDLADDLEQQLRDEPSSLVAEPKREESAGRTLAIAAGVLGAAVLVWRIVRGARA